MYSLQNGVWRCLDIDGHTFSHAFVVNKRYKNSAGKTGFAKQPTMSPKIHVGNLIKTKFEENGLTVSEFARRIIRTRTVVYDIFNRESIDIKMLEDISRALNYDFIKSYIEQDTEELYIVLKIVEKEKLPQEEPYLFIHKIMSIK